MAIFFERLVGINTTVNTVGVSGELQTQEIEHQNSLGMTILNRVD